MASSKLSAPAARALIVQLESRARLVNNVRATIGRHLIGLMSLVGMLPCSVGADEKPARPVDGGVSIEFRGDRIFIGVGFLFLELELIGVRVFDGAIELGSEMG